MRLDLFADLKHESSTLVLNILCVTYFLTSITTVCLNRKLAICVRYGKRCQRFVLASCDFYV